MRPWRFLAVAAIVTATPAYADDAIDLNLGEFVRTPEAAPEIYLSPGDLVWTPEPAPQINLSPGEFVWTPEVASAGLVRVVVSLSEQRVYVYRDRVRIGVSTASTGRAGYETPTGTFAILEKRVKHRSRTYDNAPMPYMQRLTWDGVALHAGRVSGRPASHGCIRLPLTFAQRLFEATFPGTIVVIEN